MKNVNLHKGFTLIEALIVVVIISVIAAVSIPAYNESVKKTRRVDAQAALTSLAAALERNYTVKSTYLGVDDGADVEGSIPAASFFASQAPLEGAVKFYDLRMVLAVNSYTVLAVPKGAQASDGKLRLSSTNERKWDKQNNGTYSAAW